MAHMKNYILYVIATNDPPTECRIFHNLFPGEHKNTSCLQENKLFIFHRSKHIK